MKPSVDFQAVVAFFLTIAALLAAGAFARRQSIPVAVALVFSFCVGLWLWWPVLAPWLAQLEGPTDLGEFGDMFGPLSALFSSLALLGIAVTVWFERDVNRRQRDESQRQQGLIQQQAFESTFFNLAAQFRALRPTELVDPQSTIGRRSHFSEAAAELAATFVEGSFCEQPADQRESVIADELFDPFYGANVDTLGPYFRLLEQWLLFIEGSVLTAQAKGAYMDLAKAQLSNSDLIVLAVAAMTPTRSSLKRLIETHALLEHLIDQDPTCEFRLAVQGVLPRSSFSSRTNPKWGSAGFTSTVAPPATP